MQRWSVVKKQNAQKFAALVCLLGLTAFWIFSNLWFQEGENSLVKTIEPVSNRWGVQSIRWCHCLFLTKKLLHFLLNVYFLVFIFSYAYLTCKHDSVETEIETPHPFVFPKVCTRYMVCVRHRIYFMSMINVMYLRPKHHQLTLTSYKIFNITYKTYKIMYICI